MGNSLPLSAAYSTFVWDSEFSDEEWKGDLQILRHLAGQLHHNREEKALLELGGKIWKSSGWPTPSMHRCIKGKSTVGSLQWKTCWRFFHAWGLFWANFWVEVYFGWDCEPWQPVHISHLRKFQLLAPEYLWCSSSSLFHLFDAFLLAFSPFWCFRTMIMRSLYNALRVPCSLFGLVDCMRNLLQDLHPPPLWSQCRREDASRETFLDANHPTANATNHPTHPKTRALGQLCLCIIYQSVIRVHNPNELIFSVRGRWCANLHEPTLYSCNCFSRWIMRLQNFHDCPRHPWFIRV